MLKRNFWKVRSLKTIRRAKKEVILKRNESIDDPDKEKSIVENSLKKLEKKKRKLAELGINLDFEPIDAPKSGETQVKKQKVIEKRSVGKKPVKK